MREFIYCARAGCRTRANIATGYCPQHRAASVDTHPKGEDPSGAEFMGSAVPSETSADAQKDIPNA